MSAPEQYWDRKTSIEVPAVFAVFTKINFFENDTIATVNPISQNSSATTRRRTRLRVLPSRRGWARRVAWKIIRTPAAKRIDNAIERCWVANARRTPAECY